MGAEEVKAKAIQRAKPPEDSTAPPPEPTGLLDRANWDRFVLFGLFRNVFPGVRFFQRPVEAWTKVELHDFLQWALAMRYGEEYVGEILEMWERLKVEQDAEMERMVAAQRLARGR
jgi:hypothetical protein